MITKLLASKSLKPSKRNELEIVDLLNKYRKENKLTAEFLGRGGACDTGSIDDFIILLICLALENRQGHKIACLNYKQFLIKNKDIKDAISFMETAYIQII